MIFNDNDPIGGLGDYMRGSAFGGSGPLGIPRNFAEFLGAEDSRKQAAALTVGRGVGGLLAAAAGNSGRDDFFVWLYPVAAMTIFAIWHALSYLLSEIAAHAFGPISWCPTSSAFSLLPS